MRRAWPWAIRTQLCKRRTVVRACDILVKITIDNWNMQIGTCNTLSKPGLTIGTCHCASLQHIVKMRIENWNTLSKSGFQIGTWNILSKQGFRIRTCLFSSISFALASVVSWQHLDDKSLNEFKDYSNSEHLTCSRAEVWLESLYVGKVAS